MKPRINGPGRDWATDFDHTDPDYNATAPEIWRSLRDRCPMAHTERFGGMWVPLTHDLVRAVAYDTTHFTSRSVVVSTIPPKGVAPVGSAPPITSDPPFHREARGLLQPVFAPRAVELMEPKVRAICDQLLSNLPSGTSPFDASLDYARRIPVAVMAQWLGLPDSDHELILGFVHDLLEIVSEDPTIQQPGRDRLDRYLTEQITARRARPSDDLISYLLSATIGGRPLSDSHVAGTIMLLLLAGVDTTWSAIGSALWHFARNPADAERMRRDPDGVPVAVEELLRAYAPVTMARVVKEDCVFEGYSLRAGEWMLLPFPAANRDPAKFPDPDEVKLDRADNRHAAFGLGVHRCLGSHLARLELRIALECFLARVESFTLDADHEVAWSQGQVRGPRRLPLLVTVSEPMRTGKV